MISSIYMKPSAAVEFILYLNVTYRIEFVTRELYFVTEFVISQERRII